MTKAGVLLFFCVILLSLLGIFILYESSTYYALLSVNDKYYFVKNQIMWFTLGIITCIFVSKINYKNYYRFALPGLVLSLILLIAVFLPGLGIELKGAHRWIDLGFISFQPSEILKISLTLYLAAWLASPEKSKLAAFLLLLSASVLLVIMEPDMGTAFIIALTAVIVYFLSGAPIRDILMIVAVVVVGSVGLIIVEPYRMARLTSFQNVNVEDLSTTSYHVKQVLLALGSGGLTGSGFGNSVQKYAYLPESTTDSIFAIFAEEGGFLASTILILIFGTFVSLGFLIAFQAPDIFGKLLAAGIISFMAIQAFVNLASQAILIPLTGVPLPFISYGGTSLIINLVATGILLSIARRGNAQKEKKLHPRLIRKM